MGSCDRQPLQVLSRIRTAAGGMRSLNASRCFFTVSCARINTLFLYRCFASFAQMHPEGGVVSVLKFVFLYIFFWDFFF